MTYVPVNPTTGEVFAYQWLTDVYGRDEATAAMGLPTWELRISLYPEVLRLGPSGDAVLEFFGAVNASAAVDEVALFNVFHGLWDRVIRFRLNEGFLPEPAVEERFLLELLQDEAIRSFAVRLGATVAEGAAVVAFALSVHRFPLEVRKLLAGLTAEVDEVLRSVLLPVVPWDELGVLGR